MRHSGPLRAKKRIGYGGFAFGGPIDDNGEHERRIVRHVGNAFDGQIPFPAKVALPPALGIGRDNGNEQDTASDLPTDVRVPCFATTKLALVEPNLDPESPKRIGNALRRRAVLPRIAEENGPGRNWRRSRFRRWTSRSHFLKWWSWIGRTVLYPRKSLSSVKIASSCRTAAAGKRRPFPKTEQKSNSSPR